MSNRLANESSPYLLQHAENPVDWYPWGEEAFARARADDKPILLSVGYSACHWCHVMAHESFENVATADLMNRYFVSVKLDREERPDIDGVYMAAVQALTGQGGWPMTVFMTAEGRPFFAGTYFPPADAHGRPGFPRVLEVLHDKWVNDRDALLRSAESIAAHLKEAGERSPGGSLDLTPELSQRAVGLFREVFDAAWGGFGGSPKFPGPSNLEFLLSYASGSGRLDGAEPTALDMVLRTLQRMATGGMYDQLGGGFARYSVDERWMVPHFEKMLYDNAQLARVYLHAFQVTGDAFFERIARETLAYLEREMLDPEGGFYAAQDADSDGIEGKYYVWTAAEVDDHLGDDSALFKAWFGVTEDGNFHDPHHPELTNRNVLTNWQNAATVAEQSGIPLPELAARVEQLRTRMLAVRDSRIRPGLDDKLLASWNGLALAAFAEAARVLGNASYRDVAEHTAAFLKEKMWSHGRLLHTYKNGTARVKGMLEDYAYTGLGLIELFKLTGEMEHLDWAREIFETAMLEFRDHESGGFFETPASGEALIVRQKPFFDAATPGGNGALALLALWIGRYYNRAEGEEVAREVLNQVHDHMLRATTGFGTLWQVVEFVLAPRREAVVVGEPAARQPFEQELGNRYLPFLAVAPTTDATGLPMFEGRGVDAGAVAYICENLVCQLPVTTSEALAAQLG